MPSPVVLGPRLSAASPPASLPAVLEALASPKRRSASALADIYTLAWTTVPARVFARQPTPFLTRADLLDILDFKLMFGSNRPALRAMVSKIEDTAVIDASTRAFAALVEPASSSSSSPASPPAPSSPSSVRAALDALVILRGIGPATASLVLSIVSPSVPFFSDEAAVRVLQPAGGRKALKYSLKEWDAFFEGCGGLGKVDAGGRRAWERQVWAEEVLKAHGDTMQQGRAEQAAGQGKGKGSKEPASSGGVRAKRPSDISLGGKTEEEEVTEEASGGTPLAKKRRRG